MLDDVTSINENEIDGGTIGTEVAPAPTVSETRTSTQLLVEDIGFGRSQAKGLTEDYAELHGKSLFLEWQTLTATRARSSLTALLDELGDLGFSWRMVARLVGVTAPAVQKWRRGEKATGDSRGRVASLLAACDLISKHYLIEDVAQWFEIPLLVGIAPVTPADLYAAGQVQLLFDYAGGHGDPEQILSEFDPTWRDRYRSEFESFRGADGLRSIRPRAGT